MLSASKKHSRTVNFIIKNRLIQQTTTVSVEGKMSHQKATLSTTTKPRMLKAEIFEERRIGSAITELCSQKQVLIENARSRYSNRTVTLIEHSPKIL